MRTEQIIRQKIRQLEAEETKLAAIVASRSDDYGDFFTPAIRHRLAVLQARLHALRWVLEETEELSGADRREVGASAV